MFFLSCSSFLPRKEIISDSLFTASYSLLEFCSHADGTWNKKDRLSLAREKQHTKVAAVPGGMNHTPGSLWSPNLCEWHCHPPFHSRLKPETHSWFFSCQQELAPKHILYLSLSLLLYCYYPGPNRHHFSPRILQYFSHKATRIIL